MASFRPERIAEMIHRELAMRFRNEIKDPRIEPVSFTHVDVSKDLKKATISYLPLGGGETSQEMIDAMGDVAKKLRGPIGRALRLRHAPELCFSVDHHTAEAFRISNILDDVRQAREARDDEADDSTPENDDE